MPRHAGNYAGRAGKAWTRVRDAVYATETHCWLCGGYVDQTLPRGHPMARTADHLVQLCHGGRPTDRANLRLAHGACNSGRSNAMRRTTPANCACSLNLPCSPLNPVAHRGYVSADLADI